jgi:hypothetical protein
MNVKEFQIPDNPNVFFSWLKKMSEKVWENVELKRGVFGFQNQRETKWLEGLSEEEITEYENELGFAFPKIYKFYLRNMNGTNKPAINNYGDSEVVAYAADYYSFPRDLEIVKDRIKWIYDEFLINEEEVKRKNIPHIIPIVGHRFLIADNCAENLVLSMYGRDVIIYAPNLQKFLVADIFENSSMVETNLNYEVKLWLDDDLEYLNT